MRTPVPLREAAALLAVSRQHVSRLVKAGELHPQVAPCGCRLFDVEEILARRHTPPSSGRPRKGEMPDQKGVVEPLTIEFDPSSPDPWGHAETHLIIVQQPVTVTEAGRVRDRLTPGRWSCESPLAQQLVRAGLAIWDRR